jgi:hypothetical protein
MKDPVFLFDVRVDLSENLPVQTVDVPVSYQKARAVWVRICSSGENGLTQWTMVTIMDKGSPAKAEHRLSLLVCHRSENGHTYLPAGAGRFIGMVKTGFHYEHVWAFFEMGPESPAHSKTASKQPSPAAVKGTGAPAVSIVPSSDPTPSTPPPPDPGAPWF